MELIDKDEAIAEIEKAVDEPAPSHDQQCSWEDGYYGGLYKAESIIENLEVKEVHLEKEIELVKGDYKQVDVAWNNDFDFIAKHFFELGLNYRKKNNGMELQEVIDHVRNEHKSDLAKQIAEKLVLLGAESIKYVKEGKYSFNHGMNVGQSKALSWVLKQLEAQKENKL